MASTDPADGGRWTDDDVPGHPLDTEAEQRLAALYRDRPDGIAAEIVRALEEMFPDGSEVAGIDLKADIAARAVEFLGYVLSAMGTGRSLAFMGQEIENLARERRNQQISQDIIYAGYRLIQSLLFDRIAEELRGQPLAERMIAAMALRQLEFQYLVSTRVPAAFDAGPDTVRRGREESMQSLLEILTGRRAGPETLDSHARTYPLLTPLETLAVSVPLTDGTTVRNVVQANAWAVVGRLDDRLVVVSRGAPLAVPLAYGTCALPPDSLARPEHLSRLVDAAARTADVAVLLGLDVGDVDALAPFVNAASLSPESREAFLGKCFGSLWGSSRAEELLTAVTVSLRRPGRRQAAEALHVHPNTLDYRLSRFQEHTGLDLRDPVDRMRCDLGLFLAGYLAV